MLVDIHNWAKGWIAKVIFCAIVVVFVFWGTSNYLVDNPQTAPVAVVNKADISYRDFAILYQNLLQRQEAFQQQLGMNTPVDEAAIREQALEALINEKVVLTKAEQQSYGVSESTLMQTIGSMPEFQVEGRFSQQAFESAAFNNGYTAKGLYNKIRQSLLVQQLPQTLFASSFALDKEAERLYRLQKQKRDFSILTLAVTDFLSQTDVSEQETRDYYDSHQAELMTAETVKINYVEYSLAEAKKEIQISNDDIEQYYQAHLADYTQPGSWQVAHILLADDDKTKANSEAISAKLAAGVSFAKLAQEYSVDSASVDNGGDLGWILLDDMPEAFSQATQSLQPGEVSTAVKTDFGTHFIKLIATKEAVVQSLAQVRQQIEQDLTEQRQAEIFSQAREDIATIAYEAAEGLQELSEQFHLPIETSSAFGRAGTKQGIARHQAIVQAAFSNEVLLDDVNSDVISLDDDHFVVIHLNEHQVSRPETLDEARDGIIDKLQQQKSAQRVDEKSTAVLSELVERQTTDLPQIEDFTWQQFNGVGRDEASLPEAVKSLAFSLEKPAEGKVVAKRQRLANGDYVVVVLSAVHAAKVGDNDKGYAEYRQQLAADGAEAEYEAYVRAATASAKIERKSIAIR